MSFSFFDVLILIGITQGVIVAPLLMFGREKRLSNFFLALAILTFCLLFFKIMLNFNGVSGEIPYRYLPNAFELASGPLLYFYLIALTGKDFRWQSKYLVHFIPLGMALMYAILIYASVYPQATAQLQDEAARKLHYHTVKEIEDWLIVVSILSYLFLGYRKFVVFQQKVKDNTADSAYPTLSWLRNILILSVILLMFLLINMGISRLTTLEIHSELHWQLYFIYQAGIVYYLSFMAYRQKMPILEQIYPVENITAENKTSAPETQALANRLQHVIQQQKIYLEPSLNIRQVAEQLEVNPSTLSQVINAYYGRSFREYINDFRIEDMKSKLLDPQKNASILSLALESGFNSEASFYRVFKNSTGLTPKGFIQQNAS